MPPGFGYFPIGYFFTGYFPDGWYPDSGIIEGVVGQGEATAPATTGRARGLISDPVSYSSGMVPAPPRPYVRRPRLVVVRPEAIVGRGAAVMPATTAEAVGEYQMFSDRDLEDIAVFLLAMEG